MKVRFKATFAGPNVFWGVGEVHDLDSEEAASLLKAGFVEIADDEDDPAPSPPSVERSTDPRPAQAERHTPAKKGRK